MINSLAAYYLNHEQDWGNQYFLVRLAYSYGIVLVILMVFVLKTLINLYV